MENALSIALSQAMMYLSLTLLILLPFLLTHYYLFQLQSE